ncbi:hypothetical protein BOX15_Mlig027205g2 [Macrostomum lignano]|uniref:Sodium/potassium-transporting ATPase subunit beta n=1 Tax=Macrostomum lignano TaxID=282301 RepID=A0A267DQJ1_9PLAT|nr:hypothetical protein BOX15_Mlig027205g2 [Macrostomum lignano]
MSFFRAPSESKGFELDDGAGSLDAQPRRTAPSVTGASSAAGGSVAARSHITKASRYTQQTFTNTASELPDRRPALVREAEAFLMYLYNPESGTILDRTLPQFFALMLSYFIFYSLIIILLIISYVIFSFLVINEDTPHLTGEQNVLRLSPALAMRPVPDFMGTLIRFRQTRPESYLIYTTHLQAYLDQYELFYNTERDVNIVDCNIETQERGSPDPNDPCRFELSWLDPCSKQGFFGYPRGSPCVLLKLNRVFGWVPDIISNSTSYNMLVRCNGRTDTDRENMGQIKYYPSETIKGVEYGIMSPLFYPYLTQVGYRSPLVAARFVSPKRNVVIMVECRVYNVRNVRTTNDLRSDRLAFELMID